MLHNSDLLNDQIKLIRIMKRFGYTACPDDDGVCQGSVAAWLQYLFSPYLKEFDDLLRLIYKFDTDTLYDIIRMAEHKRLLIHEDIKNGKLTPQEKLLVKIRPFCDVIDRNHNADDFSNLYPENKKPYTQKLQQTIHLGLMQSIESRRGLQFIKTFSGSYHFKKLHYYLTSLLCYIEQHKISTPIGFALSNATHILGFSYDTREKTWLFFDPESPPTHRASSISEIAKLISNGLSDLDENTAIVTEIFSFSRSQSFVSACINEWMSSIAFQEIHQIENESVIELIDWLFLAIETNEIDLARKLLNKLFCLDVEFDINSAINQNDATLLYHATEHQRIEIIQLLLDFGAEVNALSKETQKTALYRAAEFNFLAGAKLLLEYGANPNLGCEDNQMPPLSIATANNHLEMMKLLLSNRANPNLYTCDHYASPLHHAVLNNKLEAVDILLTQPNIILTRQCTLTLARFNALIKESHKSVEEKKYLQQLGTLKNGDVYITPVELAKFISQPDILIRLKDYQLKLDAQNDAAYSRKRKFHAAFFPDLSGKENSQNAESTLQANKNFTA